MLFQQIVNQEAIGAGLRAMVLRGEMPHALLLSGRPGTGGMPVALALTRYLLCAHKTENDSCGHCPNCQKMDRLEHPDVHFSFPTFSTGGSSKAEVRQFLPDFRNIIRQRPYDTIFELLQAFGAENKQGKIKALDIREMIDNLSLKSYEGSYKVQIIWGPEYMGQEGNFMLKLLEEPPAKTIFILVPESLEKLIATIKSRTQIINLLPLTQEAIAEALLSRGIVKDETHARQIALLADGNYNEALKLVRHMEGDLHAPMRQWFNALATNNRMQLSKFSDTWHKEGREKCKNFLIYVQTMLHQALHLQYMPAEQALVSEQERVFLSRLAAKKYSPEAYQEMSRLLNETVRAVGQNASAKMALHALSIRLVPIVQQA